MVGRLRATAIALLLVAATATPLASETGFTVETVTEAPAGLPDWLAPLLRTEGLRVSGPSGAMGVFWLRETMPARDPTGELGIDFGHLPTGALVGLLELTSPWSDYRRLPIPAGRYTLRYGVQPADGDHMGQTYFRDFLMLVPLDDDAFAPEGGIDQEPVAEAAKKSTGTAHPGVMALYQIYDPPGGVAMVPNDYGEPCLALPLGEVVMGLVVEGHGQSLPV
ncbi:MAG TPA: hypothetical protein VNB06_22530 [Thermoanaerobaculia bacterium]|nr:hypothetical protein [Thermoanaerobaculia bacterium]